MQYLLIAGIAVFLCILFVPIFNLYRTTYRMTPNDLRPNAEIPIDSRDVPRGREVALPEALKHLPRKPPGAR
jgi:hypothetical protein